jgi:hypothetical protein
MAGKVVIQRLSSPRWRQSVIRVIDERPRCFPGPLFASYRVRGCRDLLIPPRRGKHESYVRVTSKAPSNPPDRHRLSCMRASTGLETPSRHACVTWRSATSSTPRESEKEPTRRYSRLLPPARRRRHRERARFGKIADPERGRRPRPPLQNVACPRRPEARQGPETLDRTLSTRWIAAGASATRVKVACGAQYPQDDTR